MADPLVSTIIPVFNRPRALAEAVESVLAQDHRPIEVVIVDDGSIDDTPDVAAALAQRHPEIAVVRQDNRGPGLAREAGRLRTRGEFLQYLDSDDLLLPGKFRAQVAGLRAHPQCGVSYGYTRYQRPDGGVEPKPWKGSGRKVESMFPSFLRERWWDTPTPLYRAEVCARAGPWSGLRLEEDWEYDCRIAALGIRLHFHADFVAEVRDHDEPRLGRGERFDSVRLADRARAHELILGHARRAGIPEDAPEMRHFARALFLLARQCGAAGLVAESQRLFELARDAAGRQGGGLDFRLYRLAADAIGWARLGRLACWADLLRG